MSGSNSAAAVHEKTVKNKRNKRKKGQTTDINERVLTHPFRRLSTEKVMRLLMVGLDGAGKTTIMKRLGVNVLISTSHECHMETLVYENITINAWDLSGQYETRNVGRHIFEDTKGLIFVVDSTDTDRLDRARDELHDMLNERFLHKDVVLLVFANKQDKHEGMKKDAISERLGLSSALGLRHCHVEITSAITGEGLYEGLDWLCQRISFICAMTGEGVTMGLNCLKNSSANKKYDDMATGYTSQPTAEEFVDFIVQLTDGEDIYPDRVGRADLFERHPALIIRDSIRSGHLLQPSMLGTRKYYLFYCRVPNEAEYTEGYGYPQIQDQSKGVWLPTKYSDFFLCNLSDHTTRWGEEQGFIYKPVNQSTSSCWKMVMYSLADIPRPELNMVICKVYESKNSKKVKEIKSIAKRGRKHSQRVQK